MKFMAHAAQTYLHDLRSRQGLSPADLEHLAGWEPGQFVERLAVRSEALGEYGDVLELITS